MSQHLIKSVHPEFQCFDKIIRIVIVHVAKAMPGNMNRENGVFENTKKNEVTLLLYANNRSHGFLWNVYATNA